MRLDNKGWFTGGLELAEFLRQHRIDFHFRRAFRGLEVPVLGGLDGDRSFGEVNVLPFQTVNLVLAQARACWR